MDWANWTFSLFGLMMFLMIAVIPLTVMFYIVRIIANSFKKTFHSVITPPKK